MRSDGGGDDDDDERPKERAVAGATVRHPPHLGTLLSPQVVAATKLALEDANRSTTSNTTGNTTTDEAVTISIINALVEQRTRHRQAQEWRRADKIKRVLWRYYRVQLADYANGSTSFIRHEPKPNVRFEWSDFLSVTSSSSSSATTALRGCPLFVCTVNAPHYRQRLDQTMRHLASFQRQEGHHNHQQLVESVDMLDLNQHAHLDYRTVLFEGWRTVLLPRLCQTQWKHAPPKFVLVAEDDVRLAVPPSQVQEACDKAFDADDESLDILSLGHAWRFSSEECSTIHDDTHNNSHDYKKERSLSYHLQSDKKVHGTTLLALRFPRGVQRLHDAMNAVTAKKKTHFDQFLFHSTIMQQLALSSSSSSSSTPPKLAFSDPPLAGWAEVKNTLTKPGTGQRRQGGGRHACMPYQKKAAKNGETTIHWIARSVLLVPIADATTTRSANNEHDNDENDSSDDEGMGED